MSPGAVDLPRVARDLRCIAFVSAIGAAARGGKVVHAEPPRRSRRRSVLVVWMLLAIGAVTGLAWWDSRREREAVLGDVGSEQAVLVELVANNLRSRLAAVERGALVVADRGAPWAVGRYSTVEVRAASLPPSRASDSDTVVVSVPTADGRVVDLGIRPTDLLGAEPAVDREGALRILLAPPKSNLLYPTDGRPIASASLRRGLDGNLPTVRLSRSEAAEIGLVARTAMAGLVHVDAGGLGRWGAIAIGTAARQRDRETRAFWRLVLGVGVASSLVLAFGGVALREQRKELQLQAALAVAEAHRERDEQLARAERVATMGTFAMGIVHEVSTPLAVILGRAEQLLGRANQDERSVHAAQAILQQVDRIQVVIRRFLDMARGGPPALARADPGEVVRSAAASVEHRFANAGVSLAANIPPDMPEVHCDRGLLEQAIVNLLLNACDACPPDGNVEITVRSDSERVAFVVTDDGQGIAPVDADRVKKAFFTTKPPGAGTGLGLPIASEIAKSHRGELTIAPMDPRGTRACIEIPL
jgi:two-component system NtrC family sensor kinase